MFFNPGHQDENFVWCRAVQLQSYRDWVADLRRRKAEEAAERRAQANGNEPTETEDERDKR